MELNDNRPTDAEAWAYLSKHGNHITKDSHKLPKKLQDAIAGVLKGNWDAEVVDRIDIHYFGLIWSDKHYKKLATKLRHGPAAEAFNIKILNRLKTYRLEGYWDVLLENAADWLQAVFKKSTPRVLTKDLYAIAMCSGATKLEYLSKLCNLFWEGGEAHKSDTRKEEFLSCLPFTEYSEAYNTMTTHPWNPRWNFPEIVREIREFASHAKKVMLHVAFWYNPELKEPHGKKSDKKPVHYHLEQHFRKAFPQKSHKDADKAWKSKAIALQRVVIDFTMENGKDFKGSFMAATSRFKPLPEEYSERFRKDTFWDRLALRIRHKMPEIPFQHRDLLPYNSAGDNIYHSDQRQALGQPSSSHLEKDVLPIVDPTTGEGGLVDPEIEDLFRPEFGSDSSSKEPSDPGLRASTSAGNRQTASASTHMNYPAPGKGDLWEFDGDDEIVDLDTDYEDTSSPPPSSRSTGLRKRKFPNESTPGDTDGRKIVKLKLQHTAVVGETATGPSASASDGQQSFVDPTPPPRRPKMNTNLEEDRESFRLPSQPPALTAPRAPMFSETPEEIPIRTTGISQVEPPLSEGMQASPPSVVSSAANRAEPLHSASQSAPAMTTEISQAGPLSTEHKQAMRTMLDEFADELNIEGQIASIQGQIAGISQAGPPLSNEVKQEVRTMLDEFVDTLNIEGQVADMIEQAVEQQVIADISERVDNLKDQIIANKLIMEKQAAANKLDINERVADIKGQVVAIREQADSTKEQVTAMKKQVEADNTKEQVATIKKQVDTDRLNTEKQVTSMKDQVAAIKKQVEADNTKEEVATIKKQVDTDRLNTEKQATAMNDQLNVMKKQADADKLAMNEQAATMEGQLNAKIERVKSDMLNIIKQVYHKLAMKEQVANVQDQVDTMKSKADTDKLDMKEQFDAVKKQVATIEGQVNADKLNMKEQVEAVIEEQVEADKLNMNEQVDAMKKQVEADKLKMEGLFNAEKLYMEEQVAAMKGQVDAMKVQFAAMNEQVASIKPTKISQPVAFSKTSLDAIDIVNEFLDELSMDDQIAVVNEVLNEHIALVFLRVSAGTRKAWLYRRIGINRDERGGTE
ncbi:hypothetical protein V499_04971 [Pseudogymnoascus sp. VKM F-103]|nr:hypothetical protein V499_04971 [Pseudogymnoascus sp. VKM F-103]